MAMTKVECELMTQDAIDVEVTQDALLDVEIGGSAGVLLQAKSVEITENGTSVVAPDDGFDGLKSVEINTNVQIEWGKIGGDIENQTDLVEYIEQHADNSGIPTLTIPDSTAIQELAPNVLYIFETRTSTLTLELGAPIVGIANEYHFFVVCGSTAPTINFPTGIAWNGGNAPKIEAEKTYEISILNNIAAFFEV